MSGKQEVPRMTRCDTNVTKQQILEYRKEYPEPAKSWKNFNENSERDAEIRKNQTYTEPRFEPQ